MDKAEINRISDFLNDVYEGICEGDSEITVRQQLNELYRVIERLMELTAEAPQRLKPLLAMLEMNARNHKEYIEQQLAVRN